VAATPEARRPRGSAARSPALVLHLCQSLRASNWGPATRQPTRSHGHRRMSAARHPSCTVGHSTTSSCRVWVDRIALYAALRKNAARGSQGLGPRDRLRTTRGSPPQQAPLLGVPRRPRVPQGHCRTGRRHRSSSIASAPHVRSRRIEGRRLRRDLTTQVVLLSEAEVYVQLVHRPGDSGRMDFFDRCGCQQGSERVAAPAAPTGIES
jgi:hypothetical protein